MSHQSKFDHDTAVFDGDCVMSVMANCTFSISKSHTSESGGELFCTHVETLGGQLNNVCEHVKWGRLLHEKRVKLAGGGARVGGSDSDSVEVVDPETEDPRCECVTGFDYHQCVVIGCPLSKCETGHLFELACNCIGNDDLPVACFAELLASKQRWCFHWWCAMNIFH